MKEQLYQLGCSFDWDRELSTCDPKYYKWTQYLFLMLFKKGLIYRKYVSFIWCYGYLHFYFNKISNVGCGKLGPCRQYSVS